MKTYHHWQDIAFLPVINSLVEEQLHQLEVKDDSHRGTKEKSLSTDRIEYCHELYQIWQEYPDKTPRQVEWLSALKHRIEQLKLQCLMTANSLC